MGGPVLSSWIAAYEGSPLLLMAERGSNEALVPLLRQLVADPLPRTRAERDLRMAYALDHSYEAKIRTVAELLDNLGPVGD